MSKVTPIEIVAAIAVGLSVTAIIFMTYLAVTQVDTPITYTKSIVSEVGPCGAYSCAAKDAKGEFIQLYEPAMVGQTVYLYCDYTCNEYWSIKAPKAGYIEKE